MEQAYAGVAADKPGFPLGTPHLDHSLPPLLMLVESVYLGLEGKYFHEHISDSVAAVHLPRGSFVTRESDSMCSHKTMPPRH